MEGIMPVELLLLVAIAALAGVGTVFAVLCFFRTRPQASALTEQTAGRILRSETDIVRAAVEEQARGLRQELGRTLNGFQEVTLKAFGTLRDGIDVQIRTFGERLDHGVKATVENVTAISTKLTLDMDQMRAEANIGRENLRGLIEQKLEQNIAQQSDSAKVLREVLGGNFERLGIRVTESLAETGRIQLERLENVTTALGLLTEKSEKAQESLRLTVEGRLDAIRQDNAVKLDEMRQTVDEKLQGTLEQRLGASFKLVSDQLEQVFRGIGEMQSLATGVGDLKKMLSNAAACSALGHRRTSALCCGHYRFLQATGKPARSSRGSAPSRSRPYCQGPGTDRPMPWRRGFCDRCCGSGCWSTAAKRSRTASSRRGIIIARPHSSITC
jgi:DNA recombination protein RmuC